MKIALLTILFAFSLSACAHIMEKEISDLAVAPLTYEEIREDSGRHVGKTVMLGGVIASAANSADGGHIEVLQYPLTDEAYPDETAGSAGRFLVTSPTPVELATYPKGFLITVIGEIKAPRELKSEWGKSRLPTISIRKTHVWQPDEERKMPFQIPGTNHIDPYYNGHDKPLLKRPLGSRTDIW